MASHSCRQMCGSRLALFVCYRWCTAAHRSDDGLSSPGISSATCRPMPNGSSTNWLRIVGTTIQGLSFLNMRRRCHGRRKRATNAESAYSGLPLYSPEKSYFTKMRKLPALATEAGCRCHDPALLPPHSSRARTGASAPSGNGYTPGLGLWNTHVANAALGQLCVCLPLRLGECYYQLNLNSAMHTVFSASY